jgi:hypothetical protein
MVVLGAGLREVNPVLFLFVSTFADLSDVAVVAAIRVRYFFHCCATTKHHLVHLLTKLALCNRR